MGSVPNVPKSGSKRGAEEANLDAQQEGTAPIPRQERPPKAHQSEDSEKTQSPPGNAAGPSTTAAATAPPSAEPEATNTSIDMKVSLVQELNSLMLTLHSRAIENQQESTSLLAHPPAEEAGPSQQQPPDSLIHLSTIYPGSEPLGGVAVDSEEHAAQIKETTVIVKDEIERLKIVLEEKKKAKFERSNVALSPELMALLQKRPIPAPKDLRHAQPAAATRAIAAQPQRAIPAMAAAAGGVLPPYGSAAGTTQRRTNTNSANAYLSSYRPHPHPTQRNMHARVGQLQQQQQQQQQFQRSDLAQRLLQHLELKAAQYNNPVHNGSFTAVRPSQSAELPPPPPQRPKHIILQQQQHFNQQQLDLINSLSEHANIQFGTFPASHRPQQQHFQQYDQPVLPSTNQVEAAGEQPDESANFAAMLLNMMAKQQDGGGNGEMD